MMLTLFPVTQLLISAKVGLADSWAKQWRKGQGVTDEDKELAAKVRAVTDDRPTNGRIPGTKQLLGPPVVFDGLPNSLI